MPRKFLFTHNDLDGIAAIALTLLFEPSKYTDIIVTDYGFKPFGICDPGDEVTIVDFNMPADDYESLERKGITPLVYDHHVRTDHVLTRAGYILDVTRCGSKIYYDEVVKTHTPAANEFIELVNTFDLWLHYEQKFDDAVDLNRLFEHATPNREPCTIMFNRTYIQSPFKNIIDLFVLHLREEHFVYTPAEQQLIETLRSNEKLFIDSCDQSFNEYVDDKGITYGAFRPKAYRTKCSTSMVCEHMLRRHTNCRYVLCCYYDVVSYRSHNYSGLQFEGLNGHAHACGGKFKPYYVNGLLKGVRRLRYI